MLAVVGCLGVLDPDLRGRLLQRSRLEPDVKLDVRRARPLPCPARCAGRPPGALALCGTTAPDLLRRADRPVGGLASAGGAEAEPRASPAELRTSPSRVRRAYEDKAAKAEKREGAARKAEADERSAALHRPDRRL